MKLVVLYMVQGGVNSRLCNSLCIVYASNWSVVYVLVPDAVDIHVNHQYCCIRIFPLHLHPSRLTPRDVSTTTKQLRAGYAPQR